jgi:hypothetical protein
MTDKCEASFGGNQCGFNAEFEVYDVVHDDFYKSCKKHIADVMEQNDFDRAEVEKL